MTDWISVKDRLPVDGMTVLAYREIDFDGCVYVLATYRRASDPWWDDLGGYGVSGDVTHWQRLPVPPAK